MTSWMKPRKLMPRLALPKIAVACGDQNEILVGVVRPEEVEISQDWFRTAQPFPLPSYPILSVDHFLTKVSHHHSLSVHGILAVRALGKKGRRGSDSQDRMDHQKS